MLNWKSKKKEREDLIISAIIVRGLYTMEELEKITNNFHNSSPSNVANQLKS